jgi:glycerophosphoryl diester phosphodiesterase
MLVIGHRGAAGLEPENTIRSFQKAQELGVDMIETDLRLQNGKIVLTHDRAKRGVEYVTLQELLSLADRPLNLEIKEAGFESEVLEQIKGFAHKVLITSWNPRVLQKIRTLDTNIQIGPVIGRRPRMFLPISIRFLKKLNIFSVTVDYSLINEKLMRVFKKHGCKVYVYTNSNPKIFNEAKTYQRLKDLGVDGIFTDYPNLIKKI